jgi:hypothetical protein
VSGGAHGEELGDSFQRTEDDGVDQAHAARRYGGRRVSLSPDNASAQQKTQCDCAPGSVVEHGRHHSMNGPVAPFPRVPSIADSGILRAGDEVDGKATPPWKSDHHPGADPARCGRSRGRVRKPLETAGLGVGVPRDFPSMVPLASWSFGGEEKLSSDLS